MAYLPGHSRLLQSAIVSYLIFHSADIHAQDMKQCFVESIPCDNQKVLSQILHDCLRDPSRCPQISNNAGPTAVPDVRLAPLPVAKSASDLSVGQIARMWPNRTTAIPGSSVRLGDPAFDLDDAAREAPAEQLEAITQSALDLPLDAQVRKLHDTMPSDTGLIEARLGLRRPRVSARDMRNRTPSAGELVEALAPGGTAPQ